MLQYVSEWVFYRLLDPNVFMYTIRDSFSLPSWLITKQPSSQLFLAVGIAAFGSREYVLHFEAVQSHGVLDTRRLIEAVQYRLLPFFEDLERFDKGTASACRRCYM